MTDSTQLVFPLFKRERNSPVLVSIHPTHAHAILEGRKTVELRRRPPSLSTGDLLILYASSPTKAIVGSALVKAMHAAAPAELWRRFGNQMGLPRRGMMLYFKGVAVGYAIEVHEVHGLVSPILLSDLRSRFLIEPPQSWRYVPDVLAEEILLARRLSA